MSRGKEREREREEKKKRKKKLTKGRSLNGSLQAAFYQGRDHWTQQEVSAPLRAWREGGQRGGEGEGRRERVEFRRRVVGKAGNKGRKW